MTSVRGRQELARSYDRAIIDLMDRAATRPELGEARGFLTSGWEEGAELGSHRPETMRCAADVPASMSQSMAGPRAIGKPRSRVA